MKILNDYNTSVHRALKEIDPDYEQHEGLVICGTHSPNPEKLEEMIEEIRIADEKNIPVLGICFGLQVMVIYECRKLGILNATTEELDTRYEQHERAASTISDGHAHSAVIEKMKNLRVGIKTTTYYIGTFFESHWHRYKVSDAAINILKESDKFWLDAMQDENGMVLEVMRHKEKDFYIGVQFHPEYQSSEGQPHKILHTFIHTCRIQ